jgi:DNA-binding response OmpR family regulator
MDLHGKKFLVIEDDQHIFALIKMMFKPYNVKLIFKSDGKRGLETALNQNFDLILLDIMLPEKDGWEICRQLKYSGKKTPIIMLTAKVEETDKVLGLEIGADDYVTKPFSPRLLIARIKAVLRRFENTNGSVKDLLSYEDIGLEINPASYSIKINKQEITLTPKEFELLCFLARNPEHVFKREQLLDQIWGFANYIETRTIDEHIKRLRQKLSKAGLEQIPIKTIWGVGYKFSLKDEKNEI